MPLVNFWVLIKISLEWSLKPGFGTHKKCSFPLNGDVPSIEVTNKKVMYVNIFLGLPWIFPLGSTLIKAIIIINYNLFIITLTWTDHRYILMVSTVMLTPWTVSTVHNGIFISLTMNIVQPNLSTSFTKLYSVWNTDSRRIPKLTTDNSRIIFIPMIVTNSSPGILVIDLHSALSSPTSSSQSQICWCIR